MTPGALTAAALGESVQSGGSAEAQSLEGEPPLVVDLDGCLLRTDMLIESTLSLVKSNPGYLFALPWWLLGGKAKMKREIARRTEMDATLLPVTEDFLVYLHAQRRRGRKLVLATASDHKWADAVAHRLQVFDEVIATNGEFNLKGARKAAALIARFGDRGFDYAGDSNADLSVWRHARYGVLVNASAALARSAASVCSVERKFSSPRPSFKDYLRALRVHQWLKNLLLFVPLFTAHAWGDRGMLIRTLLGYAAFCLCASATYLINDMLDLASDRQHPRKRHRAFASGTVPLTHGMVAVVVLLGAGVAIGASIGVPFLLALAAYIVATLAYSLHLKTYVLIDTMTLAGLYTLRIIAGGAATGIELSFWLLAFSTFLFLSLANVKRCSELSALLQQRKVAAHGRDYQVTDLTSVTIMGVASGYISVLVLALYLQSPDVVRHYSRPWVMWMLCPIILYWISRMWIKAGRGEMDDDPLVYTVYDRASLILILAAAATVVAAL